MQFPAKQPHDDDRLVQFTNFLKQLLNGERQTVPLSPEEADDVIRTARAMEQMRSLLSDFGMSPASRSRVSGMPQVDEEDNEFDRLFGRGAELRAARERGQRQEREGAI